MVTPGFDGEQFINHLLDRIGRNARSADKAWRRVQELRAELARMEGALEISHEANRRHYRDMKAVDAKIVEWAEYARLLRSAIDILDPKARRRTASKIKMPLMPGPLETDIPF